MATLEAVVTELKELNEFSDLQVEAQLELSDLQRETVSVQKRQLNQLVDLELVMRDFMNLVPEQIVSGFADLIASNESIASNAEKAAATRERMKEREGGDDDEDKPTKVKGGFVGGNFRKGMEDFNKEGFGGLGVFKGIKDTIADIIQTVGVFSAAAMKGFALLKGAIVSLASAITLPIALIGAAIVGIVSGIMNFVEDFQSQEGGLFNKIVAGLGGFIDGFLKIITIPLDWAKSLLSSALELFGFDGAAEVLDSFSFTDLIDGLTDSLVEFIIGLKDMIVDGIKGIGKSIMGFFGFGDEEEELEEVKPKRDKRGRVISSATDDVELSEEGQEAVDALRGDGVPEVDPDTGKRGAVIGSATDDAVLSERGQEAVAALAGDGAPEVDPETGRRGRSIDGPARVEAPDETPAQPVKVQVKVDMPESGTPRKTYTDEEMQTVRKITQPKKTEPARSSVSVKTSAPPPTSAPAPQKVSGGEQPNQYVSIDPVSGKYRAFAPNLAATGGEAFKLFDNVEDANEYTKSVDPEFEAKMAAELAAFDAEFGTAPVASAVGTATKEPGTIATALASPEVTNTARDVIRDVTGLNKQDSQTILDAGIGAVGDLMEGEDPTGGLMEAGREVLGIEGPSVVGTGQESALRSNILDREQQKMDATSATTEQQGNVAVVAPSDNSTTVNNTNVTSMPIPSPMDKSDRTSRGSYRGRKI